MGMLNRVVNVAILVIAIAAVVFAFLLFRKREVLMERGDKLAKVVNDIASELDSTSGTNYANNLNAEKDLGHKIYPEYAMLKKLDDRLKKARQQAQDVRTQRDSLSETIKGTAATFNLPEFRAEDFEVVEKYPENSTKFTDEMTKIKDRNDSVVAEVVASGDKLGVTVTPEALNDNETYKESLEKFNTKVEDVKNRHDNYADHIGNIADVLEQGAPDLSGADYSTSLDNHMAAVRSHKETFDQTKRDLATAKDRIKTLQNELTEKEEQIASLEKQNQEVAKDRDSWKSKYEELMGGPKKDGEVGGDDNKGLLQYVQAKIIDVNKKWDFVVIDYGAKGKVTIPASKKEVSLPLPAKGQMVVADKFDGDKSKFIGKIEIVKVYDNCAICNILPDPRGGQVNVGDVVFFNQ